MTQRIRDGLQRLGALITAISWVVAFLIISTDDYYTIELREYHAMNWAGLVIAVVIGFIGLALYQMGDIYEEDEDHEDM